MPALLAHDPMQSSPHCSHFNNHQVFHGSSSSSPTTFCDSTAPTDEANLAFNLRFGDIPAVDASAAALMQNSTATQLQLLAGSANSDIRCSPCGDVKLLNRCKSKLGKRSTSPTIRAAAQGKDQLDHGLASEEVMVAIPAHTEAPCCAAATGLCSSANCTMGSPRFPESLLGLRKFLPFNNLADEEEADEVWMGSDSTWPALDVYSCDDFRMYEFKVRKCVRGRSHDWTECPFAHPGEKARRRDPRRYRYSGTACPDFRKGNCRRGEACEYSHGVFECWLHPSRYRTQPCKDGTGCRRRVCFFAHTPEQLRVVPAEGGSPPTTPGSGSSSGGSVRSSLLRAAALNGGVYDGSPLRRALAGTIDGTVAIELLLEDAIDKSTPAGGCHQHQHHHWIGMGSSPSSALMGLSADATAPSPISSPIPSAASSSGVPAHRRHLDRLRSMPTISIPAADDSGDSPPQGSPRTMAELMSTLQISPSARSIQSCRTLPSGSNAWALLSQLQATPSQSAPNTPNSRYTRPINRMPINPMEQASSSLHMMKTITMTPASSGSAATLEVPPMPASSEVPDSDAPDLGWVNELVQ